MKSIIAAPTRPVYRLDGTIYAPGPEDGARWQLLDPTYIEKGGWVGGSFNMYDEFVQVISAGWSWVFANAGAWWEGEHTESEGLEDLKEFTRWLIEGVDRPSAITVLARHTESRCVTVMVSGNGIYFVLVSKEKVGE